MSSQISTVSGMFSRTAVSISWECIRNEPSPTAASTFVCGLSELDRECAGQRKPMVDKPLEIRQVFGA